MASFETGTAADRVTEAFVSALEAEKALPKKEIEKLVLKARESRQSLVDLLEEKGISRVTILKAKSAALGGIAWIDLNSFTPEPELARLVPRSMALRHNLLCIGKKGGKLVVAMSDPADIFAVEYVTMRTGCELVPMLALEKDLKLAIERAYPEDGGKTPSTQTAPVGSGGKEAVEEASLREAQKKPLRVLEFQPVASITPSSVTSAVEPLRPVARQALPLSALLTLTRELSATLEIDQLLLKILDAARQLCGAEQGSILLYDESLHLLYFKCASGPNGEALKQVVLPVTEESIAGWVALHRESLIVNDTAKEARHYKGIDQLLKFHTRNVICVPILVGGKLHGVLEAVNKKDGPFTEEDKEELEFLAAHSGVCMANASLVDELHDYFLHSVEILIAAVEAAGPSLKGHVTEVARLSTAIARDLGIGGKTYETISYAALLHDVGKLRLSPVSEQEIEKRHPILGAEMLKEVKLLKEVIPLIRMHHEFFDGTGFPDGLSGEAIPLGARILSLAEDFVQWNEENGGRKGVEDFVKERGGRHDPRVLGSFQKVAQNLHSRDHHEPLS